MPERRDGTTPDDDCLIEAVEMVELPYVVAADRTPGLPWVTHRGVLEVGDAKFTVWQLSDGQRVIQW